MGELSKLFKITYRLNGDGTHEELHIARTCKCETIKTLSGRERFPDGLDDGNSEEEPPSLLSRETAKALHFTAQHEENSVREGIWLHRSSNHPDGMSNGTAERVYNVGTV